MRAILLTIVGLSIFVYADFSRSAEGVVTDSRTTLEWQDDYSDNNGNIKNTTWIDAINYCESLSLDGNGWRLPNNKELLSIVDYSAQNPSINTVFAATYNNDYWSSTTHVYATDQAWIVDFHSGGTLIIGKTRLWYVRCVRGGQ